MHSTFIEPHEVDILVSARQVLKDMRKRAGIFSYDENELDEDRTAFDYGLVAAACDTAADGIFDTMNVIGSYLRVQLPDHWNRLDR